MNANSELHIIVPGVCGPLAEIQSLTNNRIIKNWIKVLSRSSPGPSSSNLNDVVASIFNLSIEGDFPSAALTLLAFDKYEASMSYMCADPVHLQADMDHAILTSSADLAISDNESTVLRDALNQHFNQDGLCFIATGKDNWFVASKEKIQINTTPLSDAVGRNINFILPKGETSAFWKQVLTEAQMLMHSHDINNKRESLDLQSINSLWFHGCGELPEVNKCHVSSVCSNDDMFKGLARHVQCDYLPLAESASEYAELLFNDISMANDETVNVLHLSDLEHLVNYTDVTLWLEKLTEVLDHWVYPLLKMANKNKIKVILYPCNEKQYQFSRYDALKFWRQERLEQHVKIY